MTWFFFISAIAAICYVEAGRLHYRGVMAMPSTHEDELFLDAAQADNSFWLMPIKGLFILLWPLFLAYGHIVWLHEIYKVRREAKACRDTQSQR